MRTNLLRAAFGLLALVSLAAQAAPQIQQWHTPNGVRVLFVENHDLPMLDVAVNFAAGSAQDSPAQAGLAGLTHGLLDHGSEGMDEEQVARRLADVGAQLSGSFDQDRAAINLRTLSGAAERGVALDVLARVVQQPQFPDEVLQREKARVIAALKEAETQPAAIADKAFRRALYGSHPYGATAEVATVSAIQRADLEAFYRDHYVAHGAVVAIMGDVSRAEAERIARDLTGRLPASGRVVPLPAVPHLQATSEQRIAHPAKQSHILLGVPGMSRTDPDYFALYVGNYVLGGGGFVSRLMAEVRERRGLAYDVHSYFLPMQEAGPFEIGLQTRKDQADEALKLVREVVARFVAQGPTEQELRAAKQNIIGGFPLRIDSNGKILGYLSVIGFYDLPLDYLDRFTGRVEAVTKAQVKAAFQRHVDPAGMAMVMVGAPESGERK